MSTKRTPAEILNRLEWEGGLYEVFEWGLKPDHVDKNKYPSVHGALVSAYTAWKEYHKAEEALVNELINKESE